jgi:hypothetical protein
MIAALSMSSPAARGARWVSSIIVVNNSMSVADLLPEVGSRPLQGQGYSDPAAEIKRACE